MVWCTYFNSPKSAKGGPQGRDKIRHLCAHPSRNSVFSRSSWSLQTAVLWSRWHRTVAQPSAGLARTLPRRGAHFACVEEGEGKGEGTMWEEGGWRRNRARTSLSFAKSWGWPEANELTGKPTDFEGLPNFSHLHPNAWCSLGHWRFSFLQSVNLGQLGVKEGGNDYSECHWQHFISLIM